MFATPGTPLMMLCISFTQTSDSCNAFGLVNVGLNQIVHHLFFIRRHNKTDFVSLPPVPLVKNANPKKPTSQDSSIQLATKWISLVVRGLQWPHNFGYQRKCLEDSYGSIIMLMHIYGPRRLHTT